MAACGILKPMVQTDAREFQTLRRNCAELRARSMEIQLASCTALCSMAELYLGMGESSTTGALIRTLRSAAQRVRGHIEEPQHILPGAVPELRQRLARVEDRITQLEELFVESTGRLPRPRKGPEQSASPK